MSRVIKFRSWDNHREEYLSAGKVFIPVYPSKAPETCNNLNLDTSNFLCADGRMILEQFTGLQDKNGVDIYEGDVIAFGDDDIKNPRVGMYGEVGAVEFCGDGARFIVELSQTERRVPLSDHKLFSDGHTCRLVIGNIHQNPELLESK